jgi:hypothetical protein
MTHLEEYSKYICPITKMIFKHPVRCKTDKNDKFPITYEKKAIEWLNNNNTCPFKKKKIIVIEEDKQMKENIEKLIRDYPKLLEGQFNDSEDIEPTNDDKTEVSMTESEYEREYTGFQIYERFPHLFA